MVSTGKQEAKFSHNLVGKGSLQQWRFNNQKGHALSTSIKPRNDSLLWTCDNFLHRRHLSAGNRGARYGGHGGHEMSTLEEMSGDALRHTAFANALRKGILKKSPFGKISKVKPLTKTQKLQMEIDTMKRRLELAKQALEGDLDGYDPDWD